MFGKSATAWVRLAVVLLTGLLGFAFVVVGALRIVHPDSLSPARADATAAQHRDEKVQSAARNAALAFLDVDYRDMGPRIEKVLSLATGEFKTEYQDTNAQLAATAREGEVVSSGQIRYVGVTDIDNDSAVVCVAANQSLSNLATVEAQKKGQKADDQRLYRFQFKMTRVGDRWLISKLQAVT